MYRYLSEFTLFFKTGTGNISSFSPELQAALQQEKASFDSQNLQFDIEPVEIKETRKETDTHTAITYEGTFVYGFIKDHVFHEEPGNLTTACDRSQQRIEGAFTFYVNKMTGHVETIAETIAGNYWGKKSLSKDHKLSCLTILIICIVLLLPVLKISAPLIERLWIRYSLVALTQETKTCVTAQQQPAENSLQLAYTCAIETAATHFQTNHDMTTRLCMKYSPQGSTGFDAPAKELEGNGTYAKAYTACRQIIQQRVDKNATPSNP